MKKIKFNYLAIIGMVVAMGTVAFTNKAQVEDSLVWFETYDNGLIIDTSMGETTNPSGCSESIKPKYCALGFAEDDLIAGEAPIEGVDDPDASSVEHTKSYRQQ